MIRATLVMVTLLSTGGCTLIVGTDTRVVGDGGVKDDAASASDAHTCVSIKGCQSTKDQCQKDCGDTSSKCQGQCSGGPAGDKCKQDCKTASQTCTDACSAACSSCASAQGCSPIGC